MIGKAARDAARAVLDQAGRELVRQPRSLIANPDRRLELSLEHLIARRLLEQTDLFFVQIGAFDGRTGDQLHEWVVRYRWRGILVEPQPHYFEALQHTYADQPQLQLLQAAISETRETRTMYTVRAGVPGLPDWAPQVASFDRTHVDSHGLKSPDGGDVIEAIQVDCVPFRDVLADVERVDLLQVDVEGFDAEIIRMFDFETYRPSIVRFESKHLTSTDHDAAIARLLGCGYSVAVAGDDTLAVHRE
jgi:FkbM family methyltransferase